MPLNKIPCKLPVSVTFDSFIPVFVFRSFNARQSRGQIISRKWQNCHLGRGPRDNDYRHVSFMLSLSISSQTKIGGHQSIGEDEAPNRQGGHGEKGNVRRFQCALIVLDMVRKPTSANLLPTNLMENLSLSLFFLEGTVSSGMEINLKWAGQFLWWEWQQKMVGMIQGMAMELCKHLIWKLPSFKQAASPVGD